jgi:aldose 1-epimerase
LSELIKIHSGALTLAIAPETGGAVAAFECDGVPLFRPTSSSALAAGDVRGFACYPLVPFSNRIAGAKLRWGGATYSLPSYLDGDSSAIHGNGWQRAWQVLATGRSRASIDLVHDARGSRAREWPFPYRARQEIVLLRHGLKMTLAIANTGAKPFPCGLGWHPFFPRTADAELSFSAAAMWETDPAKLPLRLKRLKAAHYFSVPRVLAKTVLDNCFAGWRPPALIRWPERQIQVAIFANAPCRYLVVYVPSGADYFAVEPVSHMTDAFNRAARGATDTGTCVLAPGEMFSCTMQASVQHPF